VLAAVLVLAAFAVVVMIRRLRSRAPRVELQSANVPDIPDEW
jgi:hypothetical protein